MTPPLQLSPILRDGVPEGSSGPRKDHVASALAATTAMYRGVGFTRPWISYLALADDRPEGICSFQSAPSRGCVEIGDSPFPATKGRGVSVPRLGGVRASTLRPPRRP